MDSSYLVCWVARVRDELVNPAINHAVELCESLIWKICGPGWSAFVLLEAYSKECWARTSVCHSYQLSQLRRSTLSRLIAVPIRGSLSSYS